MHDLLEKLDELNAKRTHQQWLMAVNDDQPYIYHPLEKGISVLFEADWATEEDAGFVAELVNSYPSLRSYIRSLEERVEAGERLAGILERWFEAKGDVYPYLLSDALATYFRAIKDIKE